MPGRKVSKGMKRSGQGVQHAEAADAAAAPSAKKQKRAAKQPANGPDSQKQPMVTEEAGVSARQTAAPWCMAL